MGMKNGLSQRRRERKDMDERFTVEASGCGKLLLLVFWLLAPLAAHTSETRVRQAEPASQEESAMPEERSGETHPKWFEEMVFVGSRAQPRGR